MEIIFRTWDFSVRSGKCINYDTDREFSCLYCHLLIISLQIHWAILTWQSSHLLLDCENVLAAWEVDVVIFFVNWEMDFYIYTVLRNQYFSRNWWSFKIYAYATNNTRKHQKKEKKRLSLAIVVNRLKVIVGRVSFITLCKSKILIEIII